MRKGDRQAWSRVVGLEQRTGYVASAATLVAGDHLRRPVSSDSLSSRSDAILGRMARR
ncbi:MAG: hypothetical protein AVDCRST_MAG59-2873 [uncultured Thermomicrobiales bacterium]|uniref:Uncharacterized protein n=1 Tax=uncultured Thermomicrobiales bacterium TaxID=1645740 RepID=A0A6J4V1M4_9BACT|nr:MAG: hypothetical protein AVDCRST_MAG59-2873 [uncultured Thermomicrobiales bacterium]